MMMELQTSPLRALRLYRLLPLANLKVSLVAKIWETRNVLPGRAFLGRDYNVFLSQ